MEDFAFVPIFSVIVSYFVHALIQLHAFPLISLNLIVLKIGREWNNRLASRIEIKAGADVNILYALSPKFLFWA